MFWTQMSLPSLKQNGSHSARGAQSKTTPTKKQEARDVNIHGVLAQRAFLAGLSSTDDGGRRFS